MGEEQAIRVEHLSKVYKIFDKPADRIKESLHPFHKRYSRDFHALDDISFTVQRGETMGIIGKNGAGKSTLLKIITGVLTPSAGQVQVNGRIASLLELGAGFNPDMTGIENIYMNGTVMGYSKEDMDSRLDDIVNFADIGDFISQPVKMYSSGMFARLAFAVNSHVSPDILIVDEALSVGDIFFQNKCFRKFHELREQGVTILFVSHDLASVRQLTQQVLWLEHGKMQMFGRMEKVCDAYFREQVRHQNENVNVDSAGRSTAELERAKPQKVVFPRVRAKGRQVLSEDAAIASFFFQDVEGKLVDCLQPEHEYTAVLVADIKRPLGNLIFGFVLETNKGVQVLSLNTFINNKEKTFDVTKPGLLSIRFRFQLPRIARGEYVVSPAIARGVQDEHAVLTWLSGAVSVTIDNAGYNLSLIEIPSNIRAETYEPGQVTFTE